MKFSRERYSQDLVAEMRPLFKFHQQESAAFQDIALDPDWAMYERASGAMRIFTARQGGALVGYQVFFVMSHPHSRNSVQANQDILYLVPEMRKGFAGYRFVKFCSDALIDEGCEVVYQHLNVKRNFGRILERMGYQLVDLVYGRKKEVVCQLQSQ